MDQNTYENKDMPLTTGVTRALIRKLFADRGDYVKRDIIVEDILQYHTTHGGSDTLRKKVTPAVKKVLRELEIEGLAERHPHSAGYWKIHKTQASVSEVSSDQVPPAQTFFHNDSERFQAALTDLAFEAKALAARANALESKAEALAARPRKP